MNTVYILILVACLSGGDGPKAVFVPEPDMATCQSLLMDQGTDKEPLPDGVIAFGAQCVEIKPNLNA